MGNAVKPRRMFNRDASKSETDGFWGHFNGVVMMLWSLAHLNFEMTVRRIFCLFYHEGHEEEVNTMIDDREAYHLNDMVFIGLTPPYLILFYIKATPMAQVKECWLWSAPAHFLFSLLIFFTPFIYRAGYRVNQPQRMELAPIISKIPHAPCVVRCAACGMRFTPHGGING